MSFLNNLLKGFIRSAVNQVGRDGGRVISNQLYGDTHSSPIRISNNQNESIDFQNTTQNENQNNGTAQYSFLSMAFSDYLFFKIIAYSLICIIPFIGAIYVILRGYEYSKKNEMPIYGTQRVANGVSDRRYRSGVRVTGYSEHTIITGYAPADVNYLRYYATKGIIYKSIGWIYLITCVIIAISMYFN